MDNENNDTHITVLLDKYSGYLFYCERNRCDYFNIFVNLFVYTWMQDSEM